MEDKIKEMLENPNISFDEFYSYLNYEDIGDWDSVNSEEIIKQYINEKLMEGVHISHMIGALENNPSNYDVYEINLGNSMLTPEPINSKLDLFNALELGEC